MRIAFLASEFPVLTEMPVLHQATGLLERGHDVVVFASRRGNIEPVRPIFERYDLLTRLRAPGGESRSGRSRLLPALGLKLIGTPARQRLACRVLRASRVTRLAFAARLVPALAPFLEAEDFDLVHAHFGPTGLKAALLCEALGLRCPLLTSFYGYDISKTVHQAGPHVYANLFQRGSLMIALSQDFRERLERLGCPREKIVVHHVGVDCRCFSFISREARGDGVRRLVSVCRLVEKKGLEYAIRAVAELLQKGRRLEYHVVGDGPLRTDLERLAASLGASAGVRFHGRLAQDRVASVLAESDVLLAPSVTAADGDEEGTPVSLMEAMAMGLPVVSTWHSGIPEIVRDGESGYLVPERDAVALAAQIDELIAHPERWSEMGRCGRAWIEAHFNVDRLNDGLVEIYRSVRSTSSGESTRG